MKSITYTKQDIIRKISYKLNLNDGESKILIESVLEVFNDLLVSREHESRIELRNFGIFKVSKTKERKNARNLQTNEQVTIPSRKKITFKPSKKMKNLLNANLDINWVEF